MNTSRSFFDFGTDMDTVRACLSLIERGLRGEIKPERLNHGTRMAGFNPRHDKHRTPSPRGRACAK